MSHLQLRAADGHTFSTYLAKPTTAATRGGIVVVQEIFGVTGHIERVADQFAAQGYLAIAPALFDRQQRGVNLHYDEAGSKAGCEFAMRADTAGLMADLAASIDAVAHAGAVGMVAAAPAALHRRPVGRRRRQAHARGHEPGGTTGESGQLGTVPGLPAPPRRAARSRPPTAHFPPGRRSSPRSAARSCAGGST
jgi:carboxymethylenebutenolidase